MDLLKDQYSSEEESDEQELVKTGSVAKLKAVPQEILDKYHIAPNIDKYSEPMNLAATRGKWASFAFIEMRPSMHQRLVLDQLIRDVGAKLRASDLNFEPLHMSELGSPLPLHVSLSANFSFPTAGELDTFAKMLQIEVLQKVPGTFSLEFQPRLQVYDNVDRNAFFLALDVAPAIKQAEIRQLRSAVEESIEFCRRDEDDIHDHSIDASPVRTAPYTWSHERAHLSIARAFNPSLAHNFPAASSGDAWRSYRRRIDDLNESLKTVPVGKETLDALKFQCRGIKLTKQRSNLWIPFSTGEDSLEP
ncbi:LANO_0C07778g1_1 [Lachancea nothofagi CBS 11611]|uniref:U6 snRNA phosphodiesterase 1 n=1 Tax=Lachancea nothofagi CBS 11611 TaxID=1266666 RepID=A0A1G4J905_9SACH|nr:LANO_0C07778g1_1 [Lachancea nothofagi CBS 11611]